MKTERVIPISVAAFLGLLLVMIVTLMLSIDSAASQDAEESRREVEKALSYEDSSSDSAPDVFARRPLENYSLFLGVDETAIPAYLMDVKTNQVITAFGGVQVWGSAYDSANDRVLFNHGSTLYQWEVMSGSITSLGTIRDPGGLVMVPVGLAFHDGALYGAKNIPNEAIWLIDTGTLSATIFIDYTDTGFDFGGIAVDPRTGFLYGVNDDEAPHGSGLFRIHQDGSATRVAPYPDGQNDIDGLAISDDGIAYLVTDEPGFIYVFDLDRSNYVLPLANPWTSSETFSAGAWVSPPAESIACNSPSVYFHGGLPGEWITVTTAGTVQWSTTDDSVLCDNGYEAGGAPPGACADADQANPGGGPYDTELRTNSFSLANALDAAMELRWRHYQFGDSVFDVDITTNGGTTWTNVLNSVVENPGGPGGDFASLDLSSFLGEAEVMARFRYHGSGQDMFVHVDEIRLSCLEPVVKLNKTVGLEAGVCATTDELVVSPGTQVEYCYQVKNTGSMTLAFHTLDDNQLGLLLDQDEYPLGPGESREFLASAIITRTTVNSATWKAFNLAQGESASAMDIATVSLVPMPLISVSPNALSSVQFPDEVISRPLTISNTGDSELIWQIYEESPANTPQFSQTSIQGAGLAAILSLPESCYPGGPTLERQENTHPESCALPARTMPGSAVSSGRDPSDAANALDVTIGGLNNFVSHPLNDFSDQDVIGQQSAAIYGMDFDSSAAILYAHNNDTMQLGTINLSNGSFNPIGPSNPGANLVVTGLAIDPLTNEAYISAADGTAGSLFAVDLSSGALTFNGSDANVPFLIDISVNTDGQMYGIDIGSDALYTIDRDTGEATLVGFLGIDINAAQGIDFDNTNDTLYAWTYQGFGHNIFGIIDTETGEFSPITIDDPLGEYEGATRTVGVGCIPADTPWLSVSSNSGSLNPGESEVLDAIFDSTGLDAGTYEGQLCIESNDFRRILVQLPVLLEVASPFDVMLPLLQH